MTPYERAPRQFSDLRAVAGAKFWAARATRYTLCGLFAAALNNIVIDLGDALGVSYVTGTVAAFLVVTPIAYFVQARFTFQQQRSWTAFARFAAGVATVFPASLFCMALLCDGLHAPVAMAAAISTVVLYFWNFAWAHWALRLRTR